MPESVSTPAETNEVVAAEPVGTAGDVPPAVAADAAQSHHYNDDTTLSEYLESLLVTVLLALFATTFILQAFKIPSPSMETTLLVGDHLLVNKFIFGGHGAWYEKLLPYRPLERGDIIVFKYPYQDHTHYVKRVIGLPGDHLKIVDQRVFINGKVLNEPYVTHDPNVGYDPLNYNFPPKGVQLYSSPMVPEWATTFRKYVQDDEIVVPPGKYFAMGDNRDHSADSRYWGFVDRDAIMGRQFLIYWSVDASSADYTPNTFLQRLTGIFETIAHLPTRTRWNRMLRTVH
jgi:signal peptidase I